MAAKRLDPPDPGAGKHFQTFVRGRALANLRNTVGMTQEQVARRAEISPSALRRYENGSRSPSARRLDAILDALGVDWSALEHAQDLIHYIFVGRGVRQDTGTAQPYEGDLIGERHIPYGDSRTSGRQLVTNFVQAAHELGLHVIDRLPESPADYEDEEG